LARQKLTVGLAGLEDTSLRGPTFGSWRDVGPALFNFLDGLGQPSVDGSCLRRYSAVTRLGLQLRLLFVLVSAACRNRQACHT
jgi:hypothetical protein